jgi:hypothetical protein
VRSGALCEVLVSKQGPTGAHDAQCKYVPWCARARAWPKPPWPSLTRSRPAAHRHRRGRLPQRTPLSDRRTGPRQRASLASSLTYLLYQASSPAGQSYAAPSFTTPPGATSFSVGKLATSTSYYFVVRARDEAGNIDTNKVEVSAKTPANSDTMPPTFAGVAAATAAGTDVTLSWSAGSDNVSVPADLVYLVYQATSAAGENFTTPTYTTVPGATSYKVTGLLPNTTYYFVVRAQDTAGNIGVNSVEKSAKTLSVSLSTQVQPIFTAKCASAACHSGARPAQGLSLSSAATSYAALVNVSSTQCAANKLVAPTLPDRSYLVWKLQGTGPCFLGSQIPKGQPLAAADIATVRSWILAGAPNN